ncbi:MAG: hypothetical protein O7E49_10295, partial [Gemmatimonadetes bacterium]|nr:hypothetical protein [Gemmatimonadota bacterium]
MANHAHPAVTAEVHEDHLGSGAAVVVRARLATDCVARLAVGELHPGWNDADYEAYWQTPDIVAANQCQGCHQADPFIHSPWADQLKHPENPAETLVPVLAGPTNPRSPYFIVGEEFSQPITAGLP